MFELPVIQSQPAERVDAARNRERILCTARRLFAERGAGCVSMDEIAEQAGVGKGTLFRRFGSRAALAQSVLSEDESVLQEGMIRGEPPLGPGAPPLERLIAFGEARFDLLDAHAELLAAAEPGAERFAAAPYAVARLHIAAAARRAVPGRRGGGARRDAAVSARRRSVHLPARRTRRLAAADQGRVALARRAPGGVAGPLAGL